MVASQAEVWMVSARLEVYGVRSGAVVSVRDLEGSKGYRSQEADVETTLLQLACLLFVGKCSRV